VPVFGASLRFGRGPFRFFMDLRKEYGELVYYWSFGMKFFAIYSPELLEHVLVRNAKNYIKDPFTRSWDRVFGQGLLISEGEHWRRERRIVQPAFHRDRIASYENEMREKARSRSESWGSGGEKVVNHEMMQLTLDIVMRTLFGDDAGVDLHRVNRAFMDVADYFEWSLKPWGRLLHRWPLPRVKRYERGADLVKGLIDEMVAARRENPRVNGNDLLSTLIRLRDEDGSALTDEQVRDELVTFFLAGHETTALALTYTLYLIARHPGVQARLLSEIDEAGEDSSLLSQVLSESLRLFPPAWVIGRQALEDDELRGFKIPVPIYAIHRDPKYFEAPEEFRPERWSDEFRQKLPRAAYLPFGYGPRMCIGWQFAMTEAKLVLSILLKRFRVEEVNGRVPVQRPSITGRPKEDVLLRFVPR
jgi:cytochrome P450